MTSAWKARHGSTLNAPACGAHGAYGRQCNVWTVPLDGALGNHFEGSSRVLDCGSRKAEVLKDGRERARKHRVEHIIKNADGTIGERNSYGNDPDRSPGQARQAGDLRTGAR